MKKNYKKILNLFFAALLVLLGVFIFVYGGFDDSPGAQLLGLVIFMIGIARSIIARKKTSI